MSQFVSPHQHLGNHEWYVLISFLIEYMASFELVVVYSSVLVVVHVHPIDFPLFDKGVPNWVARFCARFDFFGFLCQLMLMRVFSQDEFCENVKSMYTCSVRPMHSMIIDATQH